MQLYLIIFIVYFIYTQTQHRIVYVYSYVLAMIIGASSWIMHVLVGTKGVIPAIYIYIYIYICREPYTSL